MSVDLFALCNPANIDPSLFSGTRLITLIHADEIRLTYFEQIFIYILHPHGPLTGMF